MKDEKTYLRSKFLLQRKKKYAKAAEPDFDL